MAENMASINLENNLNDAVSYYDFFSAFGYSDRDKLYLRTFNDKEKDSPGKNYDFLLRDFPFFEQKLHDDNKADRGVFFIVNGGGHTDKAVKTARAQFVDFDDFPFEEQIERIKAFPLEPSIIIKTKKSLHCYWLLDGGKIALFREVQERLIQYFGSDPVIKNESRVMRLYGFEHRKTDTPVPVTLIKFNPELRYNQRQFHEVLPLLDPANKSTEKRNKETVESIPVGQGHKYMVSKIGEIVGKLGDTVSDEAILALVNEDFFSKYDGEINRSREEHDKAYLTTIRQFKERREAEQQDPGFYSFALKAWKHENPGIEFDTDTVSWEEVREAGRRAKEDDKRIEDKNHKRTVMAALASVGMADTEYSESMTVTYNFDGSVYQIIDKESGEIIFDGVKVNQANPAAAAPASKEEKQLTTGGYEDVETKPTDFLFFPWFPRGKLVSVQGDSGSSKSTFMYAVGAYVTTGRDLLSAPCEDPGNVMFITIEDDPGDIKTAFLDAGGDLSRLKRIIDREQIAKLNLLPPGAQMLDKIIKAEQIKLLVLDPIQQFLTGDMNKANDTRPQLARLMNIAAANNICIVFIEHMGKDTTKAALHRAVGSVDIGAATRSMIQVVTDPEDDYFKIAFTVKNNTADFHDVQRAIRYQVKDHPGSVDPVTKKRARFHGHAEFTELLPEYNERLYKKALRKADEAEEAEETLQFEYDDDPLIITARELVSYNPDGLFIATDDLIQKITIVCGRCPYDQTKSKTTGINSRIDKLRGLMIDTDGIQMDKQKNSVKPKPYNWRGEIYDPEDARKTRGLFITPVRTGASGTGAQQTKI